MLNILSLSFARSPCSQAGSSPDWRPAGGHGDTAAPGSHVRSRERLATLCRGGMLAYTGHILLQHPYISVRACVYAYFVCVSVVGVCVWEREKGGELGSERVWVGICVSMIVCWNDGVLECASVRERERFIYKNYLSCSREIKNGDSG